MLKKRHSTMKVSIAAIIAFVCIAVILWMLKNKIASFGNGSYLVAVVAAGILLTIYTISLTIGREFEIVEQPSDYPPEGIDPLLAGTIIDGQVNQRDVCAAFYYLAQKGYFDIREYELKKFEFTYNSYPENETAHLKQLFDAVFKHADIGDTIRLSDAAENLIAAVPRIEKTAYKSIASRKNREIADCSGRITGFKHSMIRNRGEKAGTLAAADPDYVYKVLPYAYAFSITAKLSRNFEAVDIAAPTWYKPYGVAEDYKFDVIIYNAMLRNLPEQLRNEVFSKTQSSYPIINMK